MAIADLPYLHAAGDGGPRQRTQVVVIHATDNTASASSEATYATTRPDQTSAHFYVDDTSAYRALPLDNIAYGCLWHGNQISVQLELCGRSNALSDATMRCAAPIVAEVCARYGIPVRKVSASEVASGVRGICGHADITAAFPQDNGDHTDPGASFPWPTFIGYVQAAAGGQIGDDPMAQLSDTQFANLLKTIDIVGAAADGRDKTWDGKPIAFMDTLNRLASQQTSAGAPTQDQVNTAVLAAMLDPRVQKGIGDAIAAHLKVS